MAVLPAQAEPVTPLSPPAFRRARTAVLAGALVALVLVFVPPLLTEARRLEFVETIQFGLAGFALPALAVLGHPLRLAGGGWGSVLRSWARRVTDRRRHHPSPWLALCFAALDAAVLIVWRTPPLMDALVRHPWLLVVEVLSLVAAGLPLWTELVRCPPLEPRLTYPWRAVAAVVTMWSVWVMAYAVGFSGASWYVAFHHAAGELGTSADQELSTGVLWFGAAAAFVPVVFSAVITWLRVGEDPDAELRTLVRRERWSGRID